ncbi:Demethylmenaquinone methyltransferase [Rubripirellula lacrimiformis]|uniref:Demethylmenaquinone methyltransferase n=1 Tax=Rubripirellula lacrimiformis TaxID=1930273 RepID=A0A517N510_9BACT|nr:class I SAM-dependent methyltransferase [Rubripirellula lacrimiformis]QDT02223.1 Demethylmenaquinone methyltransferase [Rubripirellula lacrimiformis]
MIDLSKPISRWSDLRILWHLLCSPVHGDTHERRLENFYRGQANDYDSFRARMLHGRSDLIAWIPFPDQGIWVDMGAGTGHNLFAAGPRAVKMNQIHLVDLSSSLLQVAQQRIQANQIDNAQIHHTDATLLDLPDASVDVVTFSYSLTMIPDWFAAIETAHRILKPGGLIAVTDFYVSRKHADTDRRQHGWLRRSFWSLWFAADNVFLNGDHLAMLDRRFEIQRCEERLGSVPYLPMARAPYYLFMGRKADSTPIATPTLQVSADTNLSAPNRPDRVH